jgi:TolB-like protein
MKKIIILVSVCFLFGIQLISAEKMRIAVIDFTPNNISKYAAKAVSENISIEMTKKGDFVMIERSQMSSILSEQGLQQTGCTDTACAVEMGKLLSARKILVGTLTKIGSVFTLNAKVVDVESGKIDFAESERCNREDDIDAASRILAIKLINRITGKSYRLPAKSYSFEQTRNRFALDVAYRYLPKKTVRLNDLGRNEMIIEDFEKKHFWNVRVAPGYEFNDYFTLKIPGIFSKNSFGDQYNVHSEDDAGYSSYVDGSTSYWVKTSPKKEFTAIGGGLEILLHYPLEGFKPFVSLGVNYIHYSFVKTDRSTSNRVFMSIIQDNGGMDPDYYNREISFDKTYEYSSFNGEISLGSTVEVSKYFEIVINAGIEVPLYDKYKFGFDLVSDTGITSSSSFPANDTTTAYLSDAQTAFSKSETYTFSHIDYFVQVGFVFRFF